MAAGKFQGHAHLGLFGAMLQATGLTTAWKLRAMIIEHLLHFLFEAFSRRVSAFCLSMKV